MVDIELLQFPYSPYNEKARWALDWKGLQPRVANLMPGPHLPRLRKLTGQAKTPVLRLDGNYVCGSAAIVAALEELQPEPRLIPQEPALRAQALEIQRLFDEDFGPPMRGAVLAAIIPHARYTASLFSEGQSAAQRVLYRLVFPLARGLIRKGNAIETPQQVQAGIDATQLAFDYVVAHAGPAGYLAGDSFTVADLTAASFLAAAVDPPNSTMERPKPHPPGLSAWLERWRSHPGRQWVLDMYARHRKRR